MSESFQVPFRVISRPDCALMVPPQPFRAQPCRRLSRSLSGGLACPSPLKARQSRGRPHPSRASPAGCWAGSGPDAADPHPAGGGRPSRPAPAGPRPGLPPRFARQAAAPDAPPAPFASRGEGGVRVWGPSKASESRTGPAGLSHPPPPTAARPRLHARRAPGGCDGPATRGPLAGLRVEPNGLNTGGNL